MEENITNQLLMRQFRQCAHLQYHRHNRFQGQGRILVLLAERGSMTQRDLAEITQRRSATLSEQLELMENAGWIIRQKSSEDRRNVDLCLTEAGKQAAKEAKQEWTQTADLLFSVLSKEEKQQLSLTLELLERTWRELSESVSRTEEENTIS